MRKILVGARPQGLSYEIDLVWQHLDRPFGVPYEINLVRDPLRTGSEELFSYGHSRNHTPGIQMFGFANRVFAIREIGFQWELPGSKLEIVPPKCGAVSPGPSGQ